MGREVDLAADMDSVTTTPGGHHRRRARSRERDRPGTGVLSRAAATQALSPELDMMISTMSTTVRLDNSCCLLLYSPFCNILLSRCQSVPSWPWRKRRPTPRPTRKAPIWASPARIHLSPAAPAPLHPKLLPERPLNLQRFLPLRSWERSVQSPMSRRMEKSALPRPRRRRRIPSSPRR